MFIYLEGKGKQTYVNNDVYDGEWKEGKMHGKVGTKCTWLTGL